MKIKYFFNFVTLICLIIFINCNKESKVNLNKTSLNNVHYLITLDCAKRIAEHLNIQTPSKAKANSVTDDIQKLVSRSISTVYTVTDTNDLPAFYVFNYIDNTGWLILSADSRIEPILSYNFEGSFEKDSNINSGLALWLDATIESIELVRDSIYDNGDKGLNAWLELIHDYTLSTTLEGYLPQSLNGKSLSVYCPSVYVQIGPLLQTTWGQGCSYNNTLTGICTNSWNCNRVVTGCVATATAQIMKYHNRPTGVFSFSNMSFNHGNGSVQFLMRTVGTDVSMSYGCDGSSAFAVNSKNALKNTYNYRFANHGNYDYQQVLTDINNYHPLMLTGCHTRTNNRKHWWYFWKPKYNYSECHQWVCDGIAYLNQCGNYTVDIVHMNWGWHEVDGTTLKSKNNDFNGWYKVFNWSIPNARNFQYANDMVYQIEP